MNFCVDCKHFTGLQHRKCERESKLSMVTGKRVVVLRDCEEERSGTGGFYEQCEVAGIFFEPREEIDGK